MSNKYRFLSIGISVLSTIWTIHFATNHLQRVGGINGHTVPATEGPSALVRALRPNYPYSVISGGAYSPRELQYVHRKDDVVRAHYADFDVQRAKLVRLADDRYQYVSYRLNEKIFWTKKRLRIPKGELLLTDGANYARTRCGNRLSDTPHQAATNAFDPDPPALSLPPITPEMIPKMALANPPALDDMPGDAMPLISDAHTGAEPWGDIVEVPPARVAPWPDKATVSMFTPAYTGTSTLRAEGGKSPAGPVNTVPPVLTFPPPPALPLPGKTPPVESTPIPEPNTIYLFLLSFAISAWALVRMMPKDDPKFKS